MPLHLFDVFIEDNISFVFDVLAVGEGAVHGPGDGRLILEVVRSQHLAHTLSRLLCVVERHGTEEVVYDVGVGDVVEGMVEHGPEGPVDGAEGAPEPGPLLAAEVRREDIYRVVSELRVLTAVVLVGC